jgi:polyglutamine-binding protein 1
MSSPPPPPPPVAGDDKKNDDVQEDPGGTKKKALPKALLERLKRKGIIVKEKKEDAEEEEEKKSDGELKKRKKSENGDEEENLPPPPLPKGWREGKSEDYDNHSYYYNPKLNKSRWTRPKESKRKKEGENQLKKVPPFYWKTAIDKKTMREYYYNEKTQYCTWVMPEDPAMIAKMIRCANCGGFGQGLVKEHGFCNRCARELQVKKKQPTTKQRGGGQKRALVL